MTRTVGRSLSKIAGGFITFASLFVARDVRAQREIGVIEHVAGESKQRFALEFRFSPYSPNVDEEPALVAAGKTPYKDMFGTTSRLLFAMELDYQAIRIPYLGTLGPGLSAGYTQMSDNSFRQGGQRSTEETSLNIYPFYGVGVLRVDDPFRRLGFPLVPYGKFGVGYAIWTANNPGGTSSWAATPATKSVNGVGGTLGIHGAIGVSLALDILDRGAVRNLDANIGINHSYLFIEYYWSELNGLGQNNALRVGSRSWAAGLSFEF